MLYAILCYNSEEVVSSWSKEEDDSVMAKLDVVHQRLIKTGKLSSAARLMPTTSATTLRKALHGRRLEAEKDAAPLITDGPFAETKEQFLGFYVIDCENLEDALSIARDLAQANPGGAYELRPISLFVPGSGVT